MKRLGIFVTSEELGTVKTACATSGMFLSGGTPVGDPEFEVAQLVRKYKLPPETGLDTANGEFVSDEP